MQTMTPSFRGPERRHHKVFVTRNTEYHVRAGVVVAVRPRGSSEWLEHHDALHMQLQGRIGAESQLPLPGVPTPGERMYLARGASDVVTSTIVAIERPEKSLVEQYPPVTRPD